MNETPDRFFNLNRVAKTDEARGVIEVIIRSLEAREKEMNPRTRKRRPADQATFVTTISALVCDLMHGHLLYPGRWLAVSRSKSVLGKSDRYAHAPLTRKLPEWLDLLSSKELAWIDQQVGKRGTYRKNNRTTIAPAPRLISLMKNCGIRLKDVGGSKPEESIILKAPKEGYKKKARTITYEDTEQTILWREQLQTINDWLSQADITFDERVLMEGEKVDPRERYLRRSFNNGSFECGGRLSGGFWMNLGKQERLNGIRINGERVVSLDYGQSAHRIVYGIAGVKPPEGDLYDIPGIPSHYRDGIKKLMNALLFSDGLLKKRPKDSSHLLPKKIKVGELCRLINNAHPDVRQFYPSQIGFKAQFIESEILISVMLELIDEGVTPLPVHDCVVVSGSNTQIAHQVMLRWFKDLARVDG